MKRSRESEEDVIVNDDSRPDANQYSESDAAWRPTAKLVNLCSAVQEDDDDSDDNAGHSSSSTVMECSLPPHKDTLSFTTYADYEIHYNKVHANRCVECYKNFPSEHLLNIHIEEWHDPLIAVRRERGEHTVSLNPIAENIHVLRGQADIAKYSCFVEGCDRKCLTHQKRRMHMIDKHMYPKNFFFGITKEGIDGRSSLLVEGGHNRRRSSSHMQAKDARRRASLQQAGSPEAARGETSTPAKASATGKTRQELARDADMDDITGAMSALQFVPPNVRFGKGRRGFAKE